LNWKGRLQEGVRVFREAAEIGGDDDAAAIEVLGWRPYVECLSVCSTGDASLGQITETLALIEKWGMKGYLPLLLLERAGLARLRGDADGMTRDLATARHLFGEMGTTGWDDYARSIEG
jgi:hypothetical protein